MTNQELLDRYYLARTVYWQAAMEGVEDDAVMEIIAALDESKREIAAKLQADSDRIAEITDWSRNRLKQIDAWCDDVLAGAKARLGNAILNTAVAAGAAALGGWTKILSADGLIAGVQEIGFTAAQLKSWLVDTPLGGRILNDWINSAFEAGVRKSLLAGLRQSGIMGEGTAKAVKRMLQKSLAEGFKITKRDAITITRTYIQTANVEAQQAVYEKNADIIRGYKWLATLDTNVCARCAALDGQKYKKDEQRPKMPLHPRCRCVLLPIVAASETGLTSEDLEKCERPWTRREHKNIDEGGKRKILYGGTTKEDFPGWWKTLPEREQEWSVGKTRARLLREGKISFADIIDKNTGVLRPLAALGYDQRGNLLGNNPFNHTGKYGLQVAKEKLESLPHTEAAEKVREVIKNVFPRWSKNPNGNLPLVVLPTRDAKEIGAKVTVGVLSPETFAKQKAHHPELTIEDYLKAQDAVGNGLKIRQDARNTVYVRNEPEGIAVVVKATSDGNELYTTSMRRMSRVPADREHVIRRLTRRLPKKTDGGA